MNIKMMLHSVGTGISRIYIQKYILCTFIYICTYIHACTYTCIHTYTHAYIHTHMYTYIHTYIHTYVHLHLLDPENLPKPVGVDVNSQ